MKTGKFLQTLHTARQSFTTNFAGKANTKPSHYSKH